MKEQTAQIRECTEELARMIYSTGLPLATAVKGFTQALVNVAIKEARGKKIRAARHLGIHRNTIARHIG